MNRKNKCHSRWVLVPRHVVAVAVLIAGIAILAVAVDGVARFRTADAGAVLGTGSRLWLTGKSTMHDYHSAASDWSVAMTPREGFTEPADAAAVEKLVRESGVASVTVSVPVKALHSEKDGLDKNLQKALKADKFANIDVKLDKYTATPAGDSLAIVAEGEITVAGKTTPLKLEGVGRPTPEGLRVTGQKQLLMTQFDVKPPTMMMGTIKTRDEVVIHWDLLLAPR